MRKSIALAAVVLVLAACESLPIPTSDTDAPPPNAAQDMSCMHDCLGDGTDAELCHARCAK